MSGERPKLIILRGNSGSGKSTVARRLRDASHRRIAIVEQDYLRRFILKERESAGGHNIALIHQTVTFALDRAYDVILEGILYFPRYGEMLRDLVERQPSHVYYFDVSFGETLKRHSTKPNRHEFGEAEMRQWYRPRDLTGFGGEVVIPESSSSEQTVALIKRDAGL